MIFKPDIEMENAHRFSRFDEQDLLSTYSSHAFQLENSTWSTVEHYYQSHKFQNSYGAQIAETLTPREAYELGNKWFKPKRRDFKQVRNVLMSRALYSKAIQNEEVKNYLLETEDKLIIETSLFDHYWGIGRDQRGMNNLGKLWMEIRKKIRSDNKGTSNQQSER